jgi:hypothetical protein
MAEPLVLKASKDTFGRSNERTRNSGASPVLYIAQAPNIRTLVAFDLSGVTNRVLSATLRFRADNTVEEEISLTVAPMNQTPNNAAWKEGAGALGASGQNARPGESAFGWSAFPEVPWESASGEPLTGLLDAALWGTPVVSGKKVSWEKGVWTAVSMENPSLIEKIRNTDHPVITFGIWGTSGNGLYAICSRESGSAPELVLSLEEKEEAQ